MVLTDTTQDTTKLLDTHSQPLIDAHFDFVIEDITAEQAANIYDALTNDAVLRNISAPAGGWHPVGENPIVTAIKAKIASIEGTKTPVSLQAQIWDAGYIHGLKFALGLLDDGEVDDV